MGRRHNSTIERHKVLPIFLRARACPGHFEERPNTRTSSLPKTRAARLFGQIRTPLRSTEEAVSRKRLRPEPGREFPTVVLRPLIGSERSSLALRVGNPRRRPPRRPPTEARCPSRGRRDSGRHRPASRPRGRPRQLPKTRARRKRALLSEGRRQSRRTARCSRPRSPLHET